MALSVSRTANPPRSEEHRLLRHRLCMLATRLPTGFPFPRPLPRSSAPENKRFPRFRAFRPLKFIQETPQLPRLPRASSKNERSCARAVPIHPVAILRGAGARRAVAWSARDRWTGQPHESSGFHSNRRRPPPIGGCEPPTVGFEPAVGGSEPPAGGFEPAAGGFEPSAGGFEPSVGGFEPPAGGFEPAVGGFEPPAAGFEPAVRGFEPPAAGLESQGVAWEPLPRTSRACPAGAPCAAMLHSARHPGNTHRGARTHDHKVKGLALCRLS